MDEIRLGDVITVDVPQGRELDPVTLKPSGRLIRFKVVAAEMTDGVVSAYKLTPMRRLGLA
jgi:hypothetical protein